MGRTGRRPGPTTSRDDILDAARTAFATSGYHNATIRGIARDAAVDPALVHHHFGTKEQLFAASLELPYDPVEVARALAADGFEDFGERLVRTVVPLWDGAPGRRPFLAALRSVSDDAAGRAVRDFLVRDLLDRIAAVLPGPDPALRATLIGSQLTGLILVRYALGVEPLASADLDALAAAYGPTFQRYATGDVTQASAAAR